MRFGAMCPLFAEKSPGFRKSLNIEFGYPPERPMGGSQARVGQGIDFGEWRWYRGTSLIRNNPPVGLYSRTMSRVLWWS